MLIDTSIDIDSPISDNIAQLREMLLGDLYFFFLYFFARVNNVIPEIPNPVGRKNHFRIMADAIMLALLGDQEALPDLVLPIYLPPRYGKTEMICHAIAWCYAHNPRANIIYASYKKMLAAEKTESVRKIMRSKLFLMLFDARISRSSSAKDNFSTVQGGRTIAVGADGSGLGSGAGTTDKEPYGGGIFMDDMLKAQDAHSPAMRISVQRLYSQTFVNRRNDPETTPIIHSSQRTGQNDLGGMLADGVDGHALDNYQKSWKDNAVIIPALDEAGNALWPEKHDVKYLLDLKKNDPYTFYAQMQQMPVSDSNRIFDTDRILFFKEEPKMLATFITADTAETADRVNDASVFSMWGVYETLFMGRKTGHLGLHWISCHEVRVEPQDLVNEFEYFYGACLRHNVIPDRIFIEKKSTGGMLLGFLKARQGLILVDIQRNAGSGNKTERFKRAAPYISRGFLSMNEYCHHREKCIEHLNQITFSGGQKHDDRADTMADGIRLALDEKVICNPFTEEMASENAIAMARENEIRRSNSRSSWSA